MARLLTFFWLAPMMLSVCAVVMAASLALCSPDLLQVDFLFSLQASFSFHDNQVIHRTVPAPVPSVELRHIIHRAHPNASINVIRSTKPRRCVMYP